MGHYGSQIFENEMLLESFFLCVIIGTCGACGGGFINHAISCVSSKTVSTVNHKTAA